MATDMLRRRCSAAVWRVYRAEAVADYVEQAFREVPPSLLERRKNDPST